MPRPIFIALIAGLCFAFTARAEDKPSPAVKRILDEAVRDVRVNRQAFDKANQKPLDKARQELQTLVAKLNKDGKTKEAKDVLTQIETLEADVLKSANAPAPAPVAVRPVPQRPLLERMAGKWRSNNGLEVTIQHDGLCLLNNGDRGNLRVLPDSIAEISLASGWKVRLRMTEDDAIEMLSWNDKGDPQQDLDLQRIQ